MPGFFIGVDSGTQSTKAVIVDGETGQVMGKASKGYGLIAGLPPGHMEQEPGAWARAMIAVIREAIEEIGVDLSKVKAIGVSGQQHGFVPLDEAGLVIRPAKLWNDTSTADECEILTDAMGGLDEISRDDIKELLRVDVDGWLEELPLIEEYFAQFGDHLPKEFRDELRSMKDRLDAAKS